MLDDLYLEYDSLVRKYQLEKIETIGDAFICVNFVGTPDSVVQFALEIVKVK